jgi:hypothetical protein
MQMRFLWVLVVTCWASPALAQFRIPDPSPSEQYHVEFGATFWSPTPGIVIGNGLAASAGVPAVDFVQEFGLARKRFTEFRGVLKGGKHKLRVSAVPIRYQAATVLQRPLALGGQAFPAGASATTALNWDLWRFGYEHDFAQGDHGYVGFIAEVKYNHVMADLRASDGRTEARSITDVKVPVPNLGLVGRVYPHRSVSITAEYTGFTVPGFIRSRFSQAETFDATMKDFDVYGTVNLGRYFGVQGGYRFLSAEYEVDDDTGDLQMKGPYFGAVVRF